MPLLPDRNSISVKAIVIGVLALILLIPTLLVRATIEERADRQDEARAEIGQSWGQPQVVAGPILVVPYRERVSRVEGNITVFEEKTTHAYFLPETLSVDGTLTPEIRTRGIFEGIVYKSTLDFTGAFRPNFTALGINPTTIDRANTAIIVQVSDTRGIQENLSFTWNGDTRAFAPGATTANLGGGFYDERQHKTIGDMSTSLAIRGSVPLTDNEMAFAFTLPLAGSQRLHVAPLGKQTTVKLAGAWPSPSFNGDFLPTESTLTDTDFAATWHVSQFGRGTAQEWREGDMQSPHILGLDLYQPVDFYQQTERAVKYAILFIGLTFVTFFLFEALRQLRVHPLQYILVGFAMTLFFLLLLALSEHIGFGPAYALGSIATIGLVGSYCKYVLGGRQGALTISAILALLYGYLYLLLQMEEYTLLFGSLALFIVLAAIMFITRRVDWYTLGDTKK